MPVFMWSDLEGNQCFGEYLEKPVWASIKIPRLPESFEFWDSKTEKFVVDEEAKLKSKLSSQHIEKMHSRKATEARMILSGVSDTSMLVLREAEIRGIQPEELAKIILDKAEKEVVLELERQKFNLSKQD